LTYQFFQGIRAEVSRINVEDELELREVFFGEGDGKNYAVLCHPEDATYPISSVFSDASSDGSAPAEFRVLDCNHVLSSEKTVYERFKLKEKPRPTIFVSGKVGEPKQVPAKHLKTGTMLVKALKNLLEPKAEKIETTQDLRSKCLEKDICGLLLKGGKQSPKYVKDAIAKLVVEFPKITFAAVDTSVLYVKGLEAEFLPEMVDGQPRFAVFQKVAGSTDSKSKDRLKTSVVALPSSGISYGPMSNLVAGVVQKTQEMQKVATLPTIKTRTKKLVEEEQAKRQRRLDQQRRQSEGGSSTPPGYFSGENDGTKEGRKSERDRRRAEHRANNPDFREKTPEEIAEMERKRRQRMEEESAKWNMADEDAPPEGAPVGDGDYYVEEEDDGGDNSDEEDDEDVMDLD